MLFDKLINNSQLITNIKHSRLIDMSGHVCQHVIKAFTTHSSVYEKEICHKYLIRNTTQDVISYNIE